MTLTLVPTQKPLSSREIVFINEIIKGTNQATAYIRAGFAKTGANGNAARLIARDSIRSEIERRRSAVMVKLEKTAISTLGEVKEKLSAQLRCVSIQGEIERIEALIAKTAGEDDKPEQLARRTIEYLFDLARLKLTAETEAGRAAERLARLKGALDPARKPILDRKAALDALMMDLIKVTDGPGLVAQMKAAGFTDI